MSESQSRFKNQLPSIILGLFVTALSSLGIFLYNGAFSPRLYSLFLLFVLVVASLFILAPLLMRPALDSKRKKLRIAACIGAICALFFSLIAGLSQWSREITGCTLAIYAAKEARDIPQKLTISRGFPKWLSFLDHPQMLEFDPLHNKFSAVNLRCGTWHIRPEPSSEYAEVGPIEIPSTDPRKFSKEYSFPKRRCKFTLKTYDKHGSPLEGALIHIAPTPTGFNREQRTPEIISLEVGSYEVSFSLAGYEPSEPISRSCFPDAEEEIEAKLSQQITESTSSRKNDAEKPKRDHSEEVSKTKISDRPAPWTNGHHKKTSLDPSATSIRQEDNIDHGREQPESPLDQQDEEALATVRKKEINQLSISVSKLLSEGKAKEAIAQLDTFRRKYPGTQEAQEAADYIQRILQDEEGSDENEK